MIDCESGPWSLILKTQEHSPRDIIMSVVCVVM